MQWREQRAALRKRLTLFRSPGQTLYHFSLCTLATVLRVATIAMAHPLMLFALIPLVAIYVMFKVSPFPVPVLFLELEVR